MTRPACPVGCTKSKKRALVKPEKCRRRSRKVAGVCICPCHRAKADLPDPIRGYPAVMKGGG